MLKNITAVNNLLEELPKSVYLSMKLLYYDDVTPEDYEPPGFEPSSEPKFSFPEKTMNISLGKVDTDNHGYKLLLKTTFNKQSLSQNDENPFKSENSDKMPSFVKDKGKTLIESSSLLEKEKLSEETKKASMNCPCKCKLAEEQDIIACTNCKQLQHKTCYGLLNQEEDQPIFYCVDCANDEDYPLIDFIYTFKGKNCQEFCVTRRVISLCLNQQYFARLNLEKLLGCSKTMANAVIKKLIAQDFIELKINTNKYYLNKSNINFAMQKYFPSIENKENQELMDEDPKSVSLLHPISDPTQGKLSLPLDDITMIESSINKVRDLNLHDRTPSISYMTRKRKASSETVSLDDSSELFQNQKRPRARKVTKRNKF